MPPRFTPSHIGFKRSFGEYKTTGRFIFTIAAKPFDVFIAFDRITSITGTIDGGKLGMRPCASRRVLR